MQKIPCGAKPFAKPAPEITGAILRQRRLALGMSRTELAAHLGVDWNSLARWERGDMRIGHPIILALAMDHLAHEAPAR